jgi:hypothetical protein
MKKIEYYYPYVILGLPVAITTVLTHQLGFSGLYNLLVGFIMTFYSMFVYILSQIRKIIFRQLLLLFSYHLVLYWYQPSLLLFQYGW